MADDDTDQQSTQQSSRLSFVALSIGCLILALDLFLRRMPLSPVPPQ
jgi:hypothetical protein